MLENHLRPNTVFPVDLFSPCIPKKVEFLPPNIDGLKVYQVRCTAKDLVKKTGGGFTCAPVQNQDSGE